MVPSYTSTLTRKGQITIPSELREKLGLREGDRITWWEEDGHLIAVSATEYVKRMTEFFRSQADPSQETASTEEMKAAAAQGWTARERRWLSQQ